MTFTALISVVLTLALIGVVLWLIQTYVPMPAIFHSVINIIVVVFAIIWLLARLGIHTGIALS